MYNMYTYSNISRISDLGTADRVVLRIDDYYDLIMFSVKWI